MPTQLDNQKIPRISKFPLVPDSSKITKKEHAKNVEAFLEHIPIFVSEYNAFAEALEKRKKQCALGRILKIGVIITNSLGEI